MPLPKPVGRQMEVVCLPAEGHVVVLGTAGSGKTTMAIHRAIYLSNPRTDHCGPTLLVTFNRALVVYLEHLDDGSAGNVAFENYHKFARGYLQSRCKMAPNCICDRDQRIAIVQQAAANIRQLYKPSSFFDRPTEVFCDEIRWIAGYGIASLEQYLDTERIGRSGTRMTKDQRKPMFEICSEYQRLRAESGTLYDWDDIAASVVRELQTDTGARRYKHVVIDEGQDFSPMMIKSLVEAVPDDGSVTFFGDVSQQIYGMRMSWRDAGLTVGKVWKFQENYRNSRPIARLALSISDMPYYKDLPDIVEPVAPRAEGPKPTVVQCSSARDEVGFVLKQAASMATTRSVAILVRRREDERYFQGHLPSSTIRLDGKLREWVSGPGIRYGTYHAAKGLEFDVVILPFCNEETFPDSENIAAFGRSEAEQIDGRLLYVGVTRARTGLIMSYCGTMTSMLPADESLYEFVNL